MGNGKFTNGRLDFAVTAEFQWTAAEKAEIMQTLQEASNMLYKATGGQVVFGTVELIDDGRNMYNTEILLFDKAGETSGGTNGNFGQVNMFAKINRAYPNRANPDLKQPGIIIHELAHHIWDLGDEYSGPMIRFDINTAVPSRDRKTIPISDPLAANDAYKGHRIHLYFGSTTGFECFVDSSSTTEIILVQDCPDLPTNSRNNYAYRQDVINIKCHPDAQTCIMGDRGRVLFCGQNHAHTPTAQQVKHQMSCEDKIVATPRFTSLTQPFTIPAAAAPAVNFVDLEASRRHVLVFDISGSMSGQKLLYAKQGVKYWIENFSLATDLLSLIAYNQSNRIVLPLSQVSATPGGIAQISTDVDVLRAGGGTNIRDALLEGSAQITSQPGRAFSQVILLLTDGKHNRPARTSLLEALPALRDNRISVISVAIGEPDEVNTDELDELADETHGFSYLVGFSNPMDIESALVDAELLLWGTIIEDTFANFVPSPTAKRYASVIRKLYGNTKAPSLKQLCQMLGHPLPAGRRNSSLSFNTDLFQIRKVPVEKGCVNINFTVNHPADADIDIFLINPSGEIVEPDARSVRKIALSTSHAFIEVRDPMPGTWSVVLFAARLSASPVTRAELTVGAQNLRITVSGGPTKSHFGKGEPVRFTARASFGPNALSGLKVYARIWNSSGQMTRLLLKDQDLLHEDCGFYTATHSRLKKGHYRGVLYLEAPENCLIADGLHLVTHAKSQNSRYNFNLKTGGFRRAIPFYFHRS